MKTQRISISQIDINSGQVEGLPGNPRSWTIRELEQLKRSIIETPELIELRPPIVVKNDDRYVVLGGNMRMCAIKALDYHDVECLVVPDNYSISKLKEIVIKDNSQLGSWDYDALSEEWTEYDLTDYGISGIESINTNEQPTRAVSDGNAKPVDDRISIKIKLSSTEFDWVNRKLRDIDSTPEDAILKLFRL